ncbi:hypothetical protein IJ596_07000 [bacterium]|nr:hypothetical protein [bacterium]
MKKLFGVLLLTILLSVFCLYLKITYGTSEVIEVLYHSKIVIDLNNNKIADTNETFCIPNLETFSLDNTDDLYNKYHSKLNLNKADFQNLGYLAEDFAKKIILSKNVNVIKTNKTNSECIFAKIKINNTDYSQFILKSGFAFDKNKIANLNKFRENLANSRKLNLVIYNHKSNIYHKTDCEYGNAAHDKILIPLKQLPKGAKPCNFCHKKSLKKKLNNNTKSINHTVNTIVLGAAVPELKIADADIELYLMDFTHKLKPDGKCTSDACKRIIYEINKAEKSIDIAVYGYEAIDDFTQALVNAKNRGTAINFVYDEASNPKNTYYKGNHILYEIAHRYQSDAKSKEADRLMHNKFIIIDNKVVITGSMNYSKTGSSGYDANDIWIINSSEIANIYKTEFEQMLNGKFHNSKQQINQERKFEVGNSKLEIYFSPKDRTSNQILKYLKNAKEYVFIPAYIITHPAITSELINLHKNGIDVRIILDANNTSSYHTKYKKLRDAGIPLKTENFAGKLHSKAIIIDDKYIISGSMNLSASGDKFNDENTLIIENEKFAKMYKAFFEYMWAVIPDKYLKFNPPPESKESIGSCSDGVDNNFNGKIDLDEPLCK